MKLGFAACACAALLTLTVNSAEAGPGNRGKRVGQQTTTTTTDTSIALSGTPASSVEAGTAYSFTPSLSNPSGSAVAFSVQNKPSWAAFSTATGTLSGTPSSTQAGTYASILISASNGTNSASLPSFSINVLAPTPVYGSATLTWQAPTTSTTGEPLTDLAGYRVYAGTSSGAMNMVADIASATTLTNVVPNLTTGTWYFAVTAYTAGGIESDRSVIATKTIP